MLGVTLLMAGGVDDAAAQTRRPFRLKNLWTTASRGDDCAGVAAGSDRCDAIGTSPLAHGACDAGGCCRDRAADCTAPGRPAGPRGPRFPPPPTGEPSLPSAGEYFRDPFAAAAPWRGAVTTAANAGRRTPSPATAARAARHGSPFAASTYRLRALAGALRGGYSGPSASVTRPQGVRGIPRSSVGTVPTRTSALWNLTGYSASSTFRNGGSVGLRPSWWPGESVVPAGALPPLPTAPVDRLPSGPRVNPEPWPFRPESIPY
ncbi:MAG: hypothetical protein D6725_06595 [Planctomycetota bacterium]|nr:MAG: hypothetical protein D6725_06595 [Planctomycetota bacterium]